VCTAAKNFTRRRGGKRRGAEDAPKLLRGSSLPPRPPRDPVHRTFERAQQFEEIGMRTHRGAGL
jgi:hypothetical protein